MKLTQMFHSLLMSVLFASALTSCATLVNGTHQSVRIASHPSDAAIWYDNIYIGQTPMIVSMTRSDNHTVTIALAGYQPYQIVFSKRVSGWMFGNIIFGGFIGLAIDAITGGLYILTPEQVQAEMRSNCSHYSKYSKMSKDSYVTVVLSPNPEWKKIGNLTAKS